jgi:Flp pilus assembly protein TadD
MFVLGTHLYNEAYRRPEEPEAKKEDAAKKDEEDEEEEDEDEAAVASQLTDAKALADAERVLKRAVELAPNDYRILYAYARTRRGQGGYPTVADQDYLIRAYKQAPQVVALRFELVQVLMAHRHWREARALLGPLVNSPHGGSVAAAARKLLTRIEAGERAGG